MHYTQIGVGVFNGCGPAEVGQYLHEYDPNFTLDIKTIAHQVGNDGGFSEVYEIQRALRHFGMKTESTRFATLYWYEDTLSRGIPVIALVSYEEFSNRMYNYQQAHFMTVVKMDAEFVYAHDPLRKTGPTPFKRHEFARAISAPSWGYKSGTKEKWFNLPYQAIYATYPPVRNPVIQEIKEHLRGIEWLLA